jgi:transposase
LTTKIVALVDALGNLARYVLLPGQRHDSVGVEPLLDGVAIGALIGDKGFDNDWLRRELDERGALAVIPPKADRKADISCDFAMYRWRHLIENFFCNLKNYRRIATRYEKTDQSFAAMIDLVALVMAPK